MTSYDIVKKPIITEKTELLRREYNKYTFEVSPKANKIQIKKAIEELFNVKVASVATLNSKPVTKRHGMKLYKKYKNPTILIVIHSIHGFQKQLYLK